MLGCLFDLRQIRIDLIRMLDDVKDRFVGRLADQLLTGIAILFQNGFCPGPVARVYLALLSP
jgi:hypothetical protein